MEPSDFEEVSNEGVVSIVCRGHQYQSYKNIVLLEYAVLAVQYRTCFVISTACPDHNLEEFECQDPEVPRKHKPTS